MIILVVLVSGLVAKLSSGLYAQDLSLPGASVTGYGLPLSWLRKVAIVYPGNPTHYSFSSESFALDTVFWSLIGMLLTVIVYRRSVSKALHKVKEQ